jgi:hypothetical protein
MSLSDSQLIDGTILKVKVKGQGHNMVKVSCQRNPYFLSSFYQINSKLGVKVAYELPLS